MDYLHDDQFYNDLYDLNTINNGLSYRNSPPPKNLKGEDGSKFTPEQIQINNKLVTDILLYYFKGERYKKKADTIREWTLKDSQRQEFYDKKPEPQHILCPKCRGHMQCTFKSLEEDLDEHMRMLFFFKCLSCNNNEAVFDNGEFWKSKPDLCPKCFHELQSTPSRKNNVVTTVRKCPNCSFSDSNEYDLDKNSTEFENEKEADKKLLEQYRSEFCLSGKEGTEYVVQTAHFLSLKEDLDKLEQKKVDPAYQKALQLKKLTIVELEKKLTKAMENAKYAKLVLDKPEIDKFVIVPFTAQDTDSSRKESDSTNTLKKLLKKSLEATNWRLMSEGITYRLGYVSGKLKGYEREDDLAELFKRS